VGLKEKFARNSRKNKGEKAITLSLERKDGEKERVEGNERFSREVQRTGGGREKPRGRTDSTSKKGAA